MCFCVWLGCINFSESSVCLSKGPVPIEAPADTTPALVPAPIDAAQGADPEAGVGGEATAAPPCRIAAGTLATGYVKSWFPQTFSDFESNKLHLKIPCLNRFKGLH